MLILGLLLGTAQGQTPTDARNLHRRALVFDAHSDTALRVVDLDYQLGARHRERHIDLPRLREGGVDIQGFALWVDPRKYTDAPSRRAFELLEALEDQIRKNPGQITLVRTAGEARRVVREGKIGMLLALEGGHVIEGDLELLRRFHARGVRYMTLTWMKNNGWADSSTDEPRWGGLNELGRSIVREMNRLGMMIDLSHASDETARDVLAISEDPVILSHSCARALCNIPRNVGDEILRAVAGKGGVVGVNYYLGYLVDEYAQAREVVHEEFHLKREKLKETYGENSDRYKAELERLKKEEEKRSEAYPGRQTDYRIIVDHIDHMVKVAGIDHVGLGSDFDGISLLPAGLNDAADVPKITEELVARGYSEGAIRKILGENFMRVFGQVCGE